MQTVTDIKAESEDLNKLMDNGRDETYIVSNPVEGKVLWKETPAYIRGGLSDMRGAQMYLL